MFSLFMRKFFFSSASLALLCAACFLSSAFGRQEATPAADQAKPSAEPAKTDEKPAETKASDPTESNEKKAPDKKDEKAKAAKEKLPPKKQLRQLALSGSYDDLMQPPSLDPASLLMGQSPAKSKSFFPAL